jgi:hypothetical protein
MRLRIASKRTLVGSVLLAGELSKPVADKHSSDYWQATEIRADGAATEGKLVCQH